MAPRAGNVTRIAPAAEIGRARHDRDGVAADGELAGRLGGATLRVAEVVQADDQLLLAERLPLAQHDRPRVHARQRALALAVQAGIDEPRERDVVVGECAAREDREDGSGITRDIARPPESADD